MIANVTGSTLGKDAPYGIVNCFCRIETWGYHVYCLGHSRFPALQMITHGESAQKILIRHLYAFPQ